MRIKELGKLKAKGEANGVPGMEIVSGEEARRREPKLSGEVIGALGPTARSRALMSLRSR